MAAIAADVFRALSDPTRRAIFEWLARDGEQTVHGLTARAGVTQPAVSKHLSVLKYARLVRDRREGRETHYSAQPKALVPLVDWMSHYGVFWRDRFEHRRTAE
jgi:DNA-binding transcriptional ArsR family regulator